MRTFRLQRPSPALVVATIALIVAIGGSSYAAFSVPKNSVGTKQLRNGAVTTKKLANRAVTKAKLNTKGVTVPNALHAGSASSATPAGAAGGALTGSYPRPGLAAPEPVREVGAPGQPSFGTGWSNRVQGFQTVGFYKDPFGIVHLEGRAQLSSGTNEIVFTLPTGYAPSAAELFAVNAKAATGLIATTVEVEANGQVDVEDTTAQVVSLDGITFRAGS